MSLYQNTSYSQDNDKRQNVDTALQAPLRTAQARLREVSNAVYALYGSDDPAVIASTIALIPPADLTAVKTWGIAEVVDLRDNVDHPSVNKLVCNVSTAFGRGLGLETGVEYYNPVTKQHKDTNAQDVVKDFPIGFTPDDSQTYTLEVIVSSSGSFEGNEKLAFRLKDSSNTEILAKVGATTGSETLTGTFTAYSFNELELLINLGGAGHEQEVYTIESVKISKA